jgi:hypothetical protein
MRYDTKMLDVVASSVSAGVVNLQSLRDRTVGKFPRPLVALLPDPTDHLLDVTLSVVRRERFNDAIAHDAIVQDSP